MAQIVLPYKGWEPRPDQMPLWAYLERGGTRADVVAHRRWGKDEMCLHRGAVASQQRVGTYWHMLPEAAQARKAIWDAVNPRTNRRRIDEAFPIEIRATTRESDMFIRFKNGSTWQVLGSDNYNSFVGSPPIGVTFSEWSLADPSAWSYVRPILLENGGWAMFIWTPRGRNHATRAFDAREKDHDWFTMKMPATHTPVFTEEQLSRELKEMTDELGSEQEALAKYGQEYLVEFDVPVPGSYYGDQMRKLIEAGHVGDYPYDPAYPVYTSWDLGIDDYTAITFWQQITSKRVHVVDYFEANNLGLDDIVDEAFGGKFRWKWNMHYLPHDVKVRELGNRGRTRKVTLEGLGIKPIRPGVPRDPEERVNAVRRLLPFVYFNENTTGVLVDHLLQYKKKWSKTLNQYVGPLKDGNDHAADSVGEFAMNSRGIYIPKKEEPKDPDDRWARLFKASRSNGNGSNWKTV